MPEGDTIAYAAKRIRPVLEGRVPDVIQTPQARLSLDRWPERLEGRAVNLIDTHGKHLFMHFDGDLVLHSHLGMTGAWGVYAGNRAWGRSRSRAWIVLRSREHAVVEFDGPTLELMTEGRVRFDQRLSGLGPDMLSTVFDRPRFLALLRSDDQTRPIGDALLDQRNVAGIGNIWKAEGCWEAAIDPWRELASVTDEEAIGIIEATRPRMRRSGEEGPRTIQPRVYGHAGRPCPRCGSTISSRAQGEDNRITYWCPGCQG